MARQIRRALGAACSCDVIVEPVGKNTAPAVAVAAAFVARKYGPEAVMAVLSADHAIAPQKDFIAAIRYAVSLASARNALIVFGVRPTRPETGYGYLLLDGKTEARGRCRCYGVKRFVEKPTLAKARQYAASDKYLWNSGMFVWKAGVILEEFAAYMPAVHRAVMRAARGKFTRKAVDAFYRSVDKESIDFPG